MGAKKKSPSETSLEFCPEILDVAYVAHMLRISKAQVRNLCKNGDLPHFMVGKMYRFTRQDIIKFVYRDNIPERLRNVCYG